jgi:hypothetical protein
MEMQANDITKLILGSFIIWYLLKRTSLGAAYSTDMMRIPQGLSEGLRSAQTAFIR